ncbi:MAG: rhodanese-like domain-containing protein [Acidobacteriota bacterium]
MKYLFFIALFVSGLAGCGAPAANTDSGIPNVAAEIKHVSPAEAEAAVSKAYSQFIDVRTPEEYSSGHASRAVNIPIDTLAANFVMLEKNEPVYVICQTGRRSQKAAEMLKEAGFNNVLDVAGGTTAWQAASLPMDTRPPHNIPPAK